jgi:hypothetical protein
MGEKMTMLSAVFFFGSDCDVRGLRELKEVSDGS